MVPYWDLYWDLDKGPRGERRLLVEGEMAKEEMTMLLNRAYLVNPTALSPLSPNPYLIGPTAVWQGDKTQSATR